MVGLIQFVCIWVVQNLFAIEYQITSHKIRLESVKKTEKRNKIILLEFAEYNYRK